MDRNSREYAAELTVLSRVLSPRPIDDAIMKTTHGTGGTKMRRVMFSAIAAMAVSACGGLSTSQDYAPGTDFAAMRSWDWMPNQGETTNAPNNALIDQRLQTAVENQMEAMGHTRDTSNPDFHVGYHLILDDQVNYETVNSYWGTGYNYGMYGSMYPMGGMATSSTREVHYTMGTLIIDFFDADEQELLWRGVGEGHVTEQDNPAARQAQADDAVRAILSQFPPNG